MVDSVETRIRVIPMGRGWFIIIIAIEKYKNIILKRISYMMKKDRSQYWFTRPRF